MKKLGRPPAPKRPCSHCGQKNAIARGCCSSCHARLLRSGDLKLLPKLDLPENLTPLQEEFLVGCMLGDGCLFKAKKSRNPYLAVGRCLRDKEYALWQADILQPFICRQADGETFDDRTNKTYFWTKFTTHCSRVFSGCYESWYGTGYKKVPKNIQLTPLAMAVWFCDDGYVCHANKKCSPSRFRLGLATNGFDLEDVEFLRDILQKRYGERFSISKENKLYTSTSGARAFLKEIDDVFPECMLRKAYWRNPEVKFYEDIRLLRWNKCKV